MDREALAFWSEKVSAESSSLVRVTQTGRGWQEGQACIGEWNCARDLMSDFYVSTILVSPSLLKQSRFGDSVE